MSEIQLVNVDGIPETIQEDDLPMGDVPPAKRGRGRPPGAKNKAKREPVPEPEPEPEPTSEEPPTPLPKRKSRKKVIIEYEEEAPAQRTRKPPLSDSPRTHRHKALLSAQQQRADRHANRVHEYSSLLHEMLAY